MSTYLQTLIESVRATRTAIRPRVGTLYTPLYEQAPDILEPDLTQPDRTEPQPPALGSQSIPTPQPRPAPVAQGILQPPAPRSHDDRSIAPAKVLPLQHGQIGPVHIKHTHEHETPPPTPSPVAQPSAAQTPEPHLNHPSTPTPAASKAVHAPPVAPAPQPRPDRPSTPAPPKAVRSSLLTHHELLKRRAVQSAPDPASPLTHQTARLLPLSPHREAAQTKPPATTPIVAPRLTQPPNQSAQVEIHIGRIEITAVQQPASAAPPRPERRSQPKSLDLAEYLNLGRGRVQ